MGLNKKNIIRWFEMALYSLAPDDQPWLPTIYLLWLRFYFDSCRIEKDMKNTSNQINYKRGLLIKGMVDTGKQYTQTIHSTQDALTHLNI